MLVRYSYGEYEDEQSRGYIRRRRRNRPCRRAGRTLRAAAADLGTWMSGGVVETQSDLLSGVSFSTASGDGASVSGGQNNAASNTYASVSGGRFSTASGNSASVLATLPTIPILP